MSECNRTHMKGKNLRKKSNQEVGNLRFVVYIQECKFGPNALPKASNSCQQNLVSGFYCEGGENRSCLTKESARRP